jgi:hypothetical protein
MGIVAIQELVEQVCHALPSAFVHHLEVCLDRVCHD